MASKSLGTLTLDLVAKTAGFVQGMDKAERASAKWRKKVARDIDDLKQTATVGFAAITAAATGAAVGLGAMVMDSAAAAREIKQLAAVSGATTTEFQRMAFGAERFGVDQEKLSDVLENVNRNIGDFIQTGAGPMADFFENIAPKVGVTAEQFAKLSGPEALQLYVDSLEKAGVSQKEMNFLLDSFSSDADRLLPLLQNGGELMGQLGDEAERTGLVFSQFDLAQLLAAERATKQLQQQWQGLTNHLAVQAAPVMTALGNLLMDFTGNAGDMRGAVTDAFNGIIGAAGFVADAIEGVRRTFQVAGKGMALLVIKLEKDFLGLAHAIINFPVAATNELIDLIDSIPGIDIESRVGSTDLAKQIRDRQQMLNGALEAGQTDIQNILMEPLPSEQFKQYVDEARQMADDVNSEFDRIEPPDLSGFTGTGGSKSDAKKSAATGAASSTKKAGDEVYKVSKVWNDSLERFKTILNSPGQRNAGDLEATENALRTIIAGSAAAGGYDTDAMRAEMEALLEKFSDSNKQGVADAIREVGTEGKSTKTVTFRVVSEGGETVEGDLTGSGSFIDKFVNTLEAVKVAG